METGCMVRDKTRVTRKLSSTVKKKAFVVGTLKPHSQLSAYEISLIFREVNAMSMTTV
jgi:hypothetical protein